ncbi:hypothetical protein MKW94_009555 [Papaver nudicaule]|uniref:Cytochrome P450 n=1 Tax=Papaver nudicaule TaxID=74823 RepID=A0AA41VP57_PAPNU|nr:hypothetical protein [Papaver nudicaule]
MFSLEFSLSSCLLIILPISILFIFVTTGGKSSSKFPKSYPLVGATFAILSNGNRNNQWMTSILSHCSTNTFVISRGILGPAQVWTANPENVKHILSTQFANYPKGGLFTSILSDFLGTGIINIDGDGWKFQRQVSSHEFNTKSLRKFIEDVVKTEVSDRLIPILSTTAEQNSVLDLQDILQRFAFDNISKISFGYDPAYLSPSLHKTEFATAFEEATEISGGRFRYATPLVWKVKRFLNIGSEKKLKQAILKVRQYVIQLILQKKQENENKSSLEATDLISRFLRDERLDDDFVIDIVISFILAGQDTTSAALTWFFWLVSCNPKVEQEILKEISQTSEEPGYNDVKDMVYIHASLCESMRLYPPVPADGKEAASDDVLPDGTTVKKGMRVTYSPYAMGRMENLWGSNWNEFKPERWLEIEKATGKLLFMAKDSYTYPVFQAGPRICLGKEMAFLQMKMLVVEILRRFRVVPAEGDGFEPVFVSFLTSKMKGGFQVKIEQRN